MMLRQEQHELMDDPALAAPEHRQALEGLARLNRFSNAASLLWSPMERLFKNSGLTKLSALDVATGSGDVAISLCRMARRRHLELEMHACDLSPTAVAEASRKAQAQSINIDCFRLNALEDEFPSQYDVVFCSLFFHHLERQDAVKLLVKMQASARRMVIVSDLVRSRMNLVLVYAATRILSASPVVHFDGPASVRAAFTCNELHDMAGAAGLSAYTVESHFPCRMLLVAMSNQDG